MTRALGWFTGWLILVLGLGSIDVPTWYAVTGLVGGFLLTLFGLAADYGALRDENTRSSQH